MSQPLGHRLPKAQARKNIQYGFGATESLWKTYGQGDHESHGRIEGRA